MSCTAVEEKGGAPERAPRGAEREGGKPHHLYRQMTRRWGVAPVEEKHHMLQSPVR
jgi:hypothetical protein